jgi:hypothetical protein
MLKSASALLLAAALAVLGVASAAQAEPRMYTGSLILHEFGNDTTTGTTYPFNAYVVLGIPHGLFCNAKQGGKDGPCYGTDTRAQDGYPLVGSGTAQITGAAPRAFTIPASDLSAVLGTFSPTTGLVCGLQSKGKLQTGCVPGGSFSYYPPYIYSFEFADLKNAAGSFFGGGGLGDFTYSGVFGQISMSNTTGFGGTMRLLGFYKTVSASSVVNPNSNAYQTQTWLQDIVGAAPTQAAGTISIYTVASSWPAYFSVLMTTIQQTVTGVAFPWDVGTASVSIVGRGPFPTVIQRVGYDSRNATGSGTIQLVSPILHTWLSAGGDPNDTGGVAMLNLVFAPEPDKSLMLAAGLGLLGVLWFVSRRTG